MGGSNRETVGLGVADASPAPQPMTPTIATMAIIKANRMAYFNIGQCFDSQSESGRRKASFHGLIDKQYILPVLRNNWRIIQISNIFGGNE